MLSHTTHQSTCSSGTDNSQYHRVSTEFDTLILSDVHLGSNISRSTELFDFLSNSNFKKLILLGDIFADLNFKRLTFDHRRLLSYILRLPQDRQIEVVWVEGNHDHGLADLFAHLFNITVHSEYLWLQNGKRYIALHGHQFDRFVYLNPKLSSIITSLSLFIEQIDTKNKFLTKFIHSSVHAFQKISPKVAKGARIIAEEREADVIICGHTHEALHVQFDNIDYYNTGSWVKAPSTYIVITSEGVRLLDHP